MEESLSFCVYIYIYIHMYSRPIYICTHMFVKEWHEVSLGFLATNPEIYKVFQVRLDQ